MSVSNFARRVNTFLTGRVSLLFIILLWNCKPADPETKSVDTLSSQNPTAGDELHDSDYGIYHFPFVIHPERSQYTIRFHLPDRKLYIYDNPNEQGEPVVTLPFSEDIYYDDGYFAEHPEATFTLEDYNFDGYTDISVIRNAGTSNLWADIYLYDPIAETFFLQKELSEKTSVEVDSINRVLLFRNNGGMGGGRYTAGVIRWTNGHPVVVREEEQTSSEEGEEIFIRTIRIPGPDREMKVVSRVRIENLDDKEKQCLLEGDWKEFDRYPRLIFTDTPENVIRVDGRNGSCE